MRPTGSLPGKTGRKLIAMEKGSIHSELATGVFVCSAQAFLRLGLATTILTGGRFHDSRRTFFSLFSGGSSAVPRLYDPLGLVLQNIAATFNTKLQIERMRSILEQPVQEGTKSSHLKTTTLLLTMCPLPTGKGTVYWRM